MITGTNKKAILAVWHSANRGKTATLRELAHLLLRAYPNHDQLFPLPPALISQAGDFRLVIAIDGLIVAVESQGDPNSGLRDRLLHLVNHHRADVIFCATRTKGETVHAVDQISGLGFEGIWTSTYQTERDHQAVNTLKARHILELMQSLVLLPP